MKIDWQKYDAGALPEEERIEAEKALLSDPAARKELEGLRAFQDAVRDAGRSERVPIEKLEAALSRTVKRRDPSRKLVRTFSIAAAAAVLLAFAFIFVQLSRPTVVSGAHREFDNYQEAYSWACSESGLSLPAIDLGGDAEFFAAASTASWACFDYKVDGKTVHIVVRPGGSKRSAKGQVSTPNGEIYLVSGFAEFDSVGYTFEVHGPEIGLCEKVAKVALASCKE